MQTATQHSRELHRLEPLLLVEEISHRVMNEYAQAIAGLRTAACNITPEQAQAALATAAARLLCFADAHRALQAPLLKGEIELTETLTRLCETVSAARLQERGIRLTLAAEPVQLAADRCWRVALIVSELITNAMRHGLRGGPGNIRVEVGVRDCYILCSVTDDGNCDGPIRPGRGFDVVTGLASELGGEVGWCLGPAGTRAELSLPNLLPASIS
ncbi:MAG: ATP-binding protein [Sphingomonas sp.]